LDGQEGVKGGNGANIKLNRDHINDITADNKMLAYFPNIYTPSANLLRHFLFYLFCFVVGVLAISNPCYAAQGSSGNPGEDLLTKQERNWLSSHPEITLAPDPIFLPIEFIDKQGNYSGIAADYISLIEKNLGISFNIVHLKNWAKVLEKAQKREVDMWGAATPTPQRLEYMRFTQPFLSLPAVILVRKQVNKTLTLEAIEGMKVVVISGYGIHDYIKKKYPSFNLEVVPDIQTGLKKVSFGMADAMVVNIALATHYIEEEGITNLRIAGDSGYVYEWAFASRKDWPELRNILEKGLSLISQEERKSIYRKWVNVTKDSWISFKYVLLIFVLALLIGGVISILALNRRLKMQVQARTQELERELAERKQAELFKRGQNLVLDKLASGCPLPEIQDALLEVTEGQFPKMQSSILLLDETGKHLKHGATHHLPKAYNEAIDGMSIGPNAGSCGTAAFLNQVVIVEDIETDPLWENFKDLALYHGLKACWSYPVNDAEGKVLGTFALYYGETRRPTESELSLIKPLVHIAGLAIERKRIDNRVQKYSHDLEKSNQELQSFASIASHDLQEPLRKIITFGDRLATRIPETDAQGKNYLDRMQNSALRMKNLVKDLLQYTRIEFKARPFESLDLNQVIKNVLEDLETRICETQGAVNIKNLPAIEGDPIQIHQLFLNLIGNALKFHREGIPPVINLNSAKGENGFWEVSVEDNGIGIEEKHIDKIFKPFERLHGRTTYEGTGIGLTICNKIVARHGGKITVQRQSTNGVIFNIYLPEKLSPSHQK
jgi:signal transduction histidine kinase/ABC-type amino acid transport substrate-binding protein